MKFSIIILALSFFSLSSARPIPDHHRVRAAFTLANGQAAQKLNSQFRSLKSGSRCTSGQVACTSDGSFAQCVGGKLVTTPCSAGTKCFALPLVNKKGTSITCDTDSDARARIVRTGAKGGVFGDSTVVAPKQKQKINNPRDASTNDTGVKIVQSSSAGGVGVEVINEGTAQAIATSSNFADAIAQVQTTQVQAGDQQATVTVTVIEDVQPTGTTGNGGPSHHHHHHHESDESNGTCGNADMNDNSQNGQTDDSNAVEQSGDNSSTTFHLANGQAAQSLNSQFASLTTSSPCQNGQEACINGQFAQCANEAFVTTSCSAGLSCFAVPLVNEEGTSIVCDTEADALARIQSTGALGGLTARRF